MKQLFLWVLYTTYFTKKQRVRVVGFELDVQRYRNPDRTILKQNVNHGAFDYTDFLLVRRQPDAEADR